MLSIMIMLFIIGFLLFLISIPTFLFVMALHVHKRQKTSKTQKDQTVTIPAVIEIEDFS